MSHKQSFIFSYLHWTGFLVCTALCSSLKAVGIPLSWGPVFGSQFLHEFLQTDHTVVGRQGLQFEELTVGNMNLTRTNTVTFSLDFVFRTETSIFIMCWWRDVINLSMYKVSITYVWQVVSSCCSCCTDCTYIGVRGCVMAVHYPRRDCQGSVQHLRKGQRSQEVVCLVSKPTWTITAAILNRNFQLLTLYSFSWRENGNLGNWR